MMKTFGLLMFLSMMASSFSNSLPMGGEGTGPGKKRAAGGETKGGVRSGSDVILAGGAVKGGAVKGGGVAGNYLVKV
jgi:hypothetical protein